jgi:hypothetical protein
MTNPLAKSLLVIAAIATATHSEEPHLLDRDAPTADGENESVTRTTNITLPLEGQEMTAKAGQLGPG